MGQWDDIAGSWNYYRPGQPIKVEGGLKARSERGAIGSTWWSKRWLAVLESFSLGNRLALGRVYARQGQVLSIDVEPGLVKAQVQGSQPKSYTIKIQIQPLTDRDWEKIIAVMAAQAIFAAKLLAGEMPTNIEEAFTAAKLSLFPANRKDLITNCSCPDWANPCQHIAAVYYLLAERFDEDPFLIFKLRGRTREEIMQALRQKRAESLPKKKATRAVAEKHTKYDDLSLLGEDTATFWEAGEDLDSFTTNPAAPRVERAVLKILGDAPFALNNENLTTLLARAYDAVDAHITEENVS